MARKKGHHTAHRKFLPAGMLHGKHGVILQDHLHLNALGLPRAALGIDGNVLLRHRQAAGDVGPDLLRVGGAPRGVPARRLKKCRARLHVARVAVEGQGDLPVRAGVGAGRGDAVPPLSWLGRTSTACCPRFRTAFPGDCT